MEESKFVRFDQQVAGHDKLMLFSTSELLVVKPCTKRELDFYQDVASFPDFQDFIPECYGTVRAATESELNLLDKSNIDNDIIKIDKSEQHVDHNVCLENIVHGFTKPCILDLKMGSLLYDEEATEEKRNRMIQHSINTTSGTLGLKICGLKVYDTVNHQYITYEKKFGKSRTTTNIVEALLSFLFPTSKYTQENVDYTTYLKEDITENNKNEIPKKYTKWIIECFIDTIKEIRESVIEHPNLRLIGSSLLFIYEGDFTAANKTWDYMLNEDTIAEKKQSEEIEGEEEELSPKMCDLRLIDFAHSDWHGPNEKQDPDLIKGFDNIISILQTCLKRQEQENL